MEKPALDYVLDTAREVDITVTLERGRQALGALGLSGSMALRKISARLPRPPAVQLLACERLHAVLLDMNCRQEHTSRDC